MPRYKVLKGNLWINKRMCSKGDEVFIKEGVAKSLETGCLELLEEPEPKKKHVFVTQPERDLPEPKEEPVEQEDEESKDPPVPARKKNNKPARKKNKKKR